MASSKSTCCGVGVGVSIESDAPRMYVRGNRGHFVCLCAKGASLNPGAGVETRTPHPVPRTSRGRRLR